jgi:hypothetical protein
MSSSSWFFVGESGVLEPTDAELGATSTTESEEDFAELMAVVLMALPRGREPLPQGHNRCSRRESRSALARRSMGKDATEAAEDVAMDAIEATWEAARNARAYSCSGVQPGALSSLLAPPGFGKTGE